MGMRNNERQGCLQKGVSQTLRDANYRDRYVVLCVVVCYCCCSSFGGRSKVVAAVIKESGDMHWTLL